LAKRASSWTRATTWPP